MKKLIIFDLDGTLLDTLDDLKDAVNFTLEKYNYPTKSREHIRRSIGNGVAKLVARCIPDGENNPDYSDCLREFKKYYSEHYSDNTYPYKGIAKVVKQLRSEGFLLAVATNKIDALAHELIDKYFPNLFHFVLGDIDGVPKKPNPQMIENILAHFSLEKKDAMYIGDTNVDEQTAVNSGLDYFLLTYGYRTEEEIKETCKCKKLVSTTEGIYQAIKNESFN